MLAQGSDIAIKEEYLELFSRFVDLGINKLKNSFLFIILTHELNISPYCLFLIVFGSFFENKNIETSFNNK